MSVNKGYNDVRGVRAIIGDLGSGKSLLLSYLASKTSNPVYSNFPIKIPNYRPLEIEKIFDLPPVCYVILDEAYQVIDSRNFQSALSKIMTYVGAQLRKSKKIIYIGVPFLSMIDIRYRKLLRKITFCKKVKGGYLYTTFDKKKKSPTRRLLKWNSAEKIYKIYNTYQIARPLDESQIEYELLSKNREKMLLKCLDIANLIRPMLNENFMLKNIKFVLFICGFYHKYADDVHLLLTGKLDIREIIKNAQLNSNTIKALNYFLEIKK